MTDTTLVSSRWLRAHGYPGNLLARYMASGWLQSPARGVYLRKGGKPTWDGLLHSLQSLERLPIHTDGRFALARHGPEHYLRLGEPATLTLYGEARLPAWARKLPLPERIQATVGYEVDAIMQGFATLRRNLSAPCCGTATASRRSNCSSPSPNAGVARDAQILRHGELAVQV